MEPVVDQMKGFFAYGSQHPMLGETIRAAITEINRNTGSALAGWDLMHIDGKFAIEEICKQIDGSPLFCCDITNFNPNVMFELGYAIAKNKRVWPVCDISFADFKADLNRFDLINTIGYVNYESSDDLLKKFIRANLFADLESTIFNQQIEPSIDLSQFASLLYCKSYVRTDASNRISTRIKEAGVSTIVDDPREASPDNLPNYACKIFAAEGVICHFGSPLRVDETLRTARYALIAGMAYGWGKPLLMLTEGDAMSPIDYRHLMHRYQTASEADYNGPRNLDTKSSENKLDSKRHEKTSYTRFQSPNRRPSAQGREDPHPDRFRERPPS